MVERSHEPFKRALVARMKEGGNMPNWVAHMHQFNVKLTTE
jgi:hypothetical protein